jgi:hypothetical protein
LPTMMRSLPNQRRIQALDSIASVIFTLLRPQRTELISARLPRRSGVGSST